ncbi:MAG: leucine--tRNA ligase [Bacteroidetes bacterium]|nr:MAG: leucine--tRNA ligase [Bacteroidota bacterium]
MEYRFRDIEKKWKEWWKVNKVYKVSNDSAKPKYYVLDMFPYPSGTGLHVGHPLGYIASDIYARFKRLKGFNVLHPMGYDAFGLPAEQYAIEHGIHPAISTENNINNFRKQMDNIGFSFDWDREVRTSDVKFYKWTQWIFLQLFDSYFCHTEKKALPISKLIAKYETKGAMPKNGEPIPGKHFSAEQWKAFSEKEKADILMKRRLAYCGYGEVNWCEALGTVLANDEVINGVSERGGHPVVKKTLRQWYLRITEYADRLLEGLQKVDFSESMKEMQSNWIGKSSGATRPDTIFGVDFMVIAPELEMVNEIKSKEQTIAVDEYLAYVKSRSERERMAEKKITGVFTGAYAINPFDGREIPIWISEYVLAGYGTGAIMAVPCGDQRDFLFAKHFNIPITNIIGSHYNGEEANPTKDAILENSDFINGMVMKDAIDVVINKIEEKGIGVRKVNYKMRDAAFSRQRYWGEPFPIIWKNGIAYPLDESELPVVLPHMEDLKPGPDGEGPLSNLTEWKNYKDGTREVNTMPGYAGSSWYFLRYMDPENEKEFCSRKASDYWGQVDLYIGGTEHAVGHLLYSRMWTKFLFDLGLISHEEPYKRLVNQGMIQGSSRFVYRVHGSNKFVSYGLKDQYQTDQIHVNVNIVDGVELDTEEFKKWKGGEFADAEFILEGGKYICGVEVEKMSKSKFNTVNPDDLVMKYGADTFRMYEMFLGPVEMSKPWDTKGIEGVHRFLKKLWRLFYDELKGKVWNEEKATDAELKVLHKTIKKIEEDTERFSFNTGVSTFMICVNDLTDLKCYKKEVLDQLLILLAPYAPHVSEELWSVLGNSGTILDASFPKWNDKYLKETSKAYPVAINGKTRTELTLALDITQQQVEEIVLKDAIITKWLEGKQPKKIIYVKNKMINVVV